MALPRPVTDAELSTILDEELAKGITFANDPEEDRRERALDYYDGLMPDLPHDRGRSGVVARIVSEQIDRMLPGLLRVFDGSDKVVVYSPAKPGDEEAAAQATDYVNYVWANECDGFLVLATAIQDALQVRNGIIKVYWNAEREYAVERMTGLSDEALTLLLGNPELGIPPSEDGLELVRHSVRPETVPGIGGQPATVIMVHDVEVRRVTASGRLAVENVVPEEFGISARAKTIDTAPWVWHRVRTTRSDLVKQGYPPEIVDEIPAYGIQAEDRLRRGVGDRDQLTGAQGHGATEEVEIIEAYGFVDRDGDGIAESRKIVFSGAEGRREILADDPWDDERPFVDLRPHIVPHRWQGRSMADQTMDLARVQTALWRGALDNLYSQIRPMREVVDGQIKNPDELLEQTFGGVVRVKAMGSIAPIITPNVASIVFEGIAAVDKIVERRTGVGDATPSLDETALNPQTATASQIEHDADYARTELVARIMAQGIKLLGRKMLKIIVAHQDIPRTIRLRDKWVPIDPSAWDAGMDCDVNLGLGTGSRERDRAMLMQVFELQQGVFTRFGPTNPSVTVEKIVGTLHKIVEAGGMKNPEQFFAMPTPEQVAQYFASKPPPMDPKVAAIQAKAQADAQRFQLQASIAEKKLQLDQQARAAKVQADAQADTESAQADMQQEQIRLEAEMQMKERELQQEFALRREELQLEAHLKMQEMAHGVRLPGLSELARPQ